MLASNAVAIHRLNLKGDKRSCRAFKHSLQNGSELTLPSQWCERWILVRNLSVKARTRDWQQQTNAQLNRSLQHAIPGVSGGAAQANAIWFSSLPEMIAFLLTELALGQTAHWYWQQWRHLLRYPRDEGLARLLLMYPEHIPAIVQQLLQQRKLTTVLTQLSDGSAKTLANELIRHWRLPSLFELRSNIVSSSWQQAMHSVFLSRSHLQPWQNAIKHLSAGDGRVLFASIVFGVMYAPSVLRAGAAQWHREFVHQMKGSGDNATRMLNEYTEQHAASGQGQANRSPFADKVSTAPIDTSETASDQRGIVVQAIQASAVKFKPAHAVSITSKTETLSAAKVTTDTNKNVPRQHSGDVDAPIADHQLSPVDATNTDVVENHHWLADSFLTQFGGVFYLLNPLRSLVTPEQLLPFEGGSAWHGWWDVYRAFAQRFGATDAFTDKPLRDFFAAQIFPFHCEQERRQHFEQINCRPPHAFAVEWFTQIEKRFSDQLFWQDLQQGAGFFATPAHVVSSASHLDVYFPLNKARLELRLAAWDINPGWLSWLSRVVTFHYVDSLDEVGAP